MGSHTFTWAHPAQEVYVTGTFDNWSKSVRLEKTGDVFQKTVDLPAEKVFFKYVVDGAWTTDHSANQETDPSGNLNNVLHAHDIRSGNSSSAAFLSSAAPHSTSAALAGQQPLENDRNADLPLETPGDDLPGAFPVTPMNDAQQFSVNPIPATEGNGNPIKLAPGEPVPHPSTLTNNTIHSTVRSDPDLQQGRDKDDYESAFGVAPIPATGGIGNPIHLKPGEPVPHPSTLTRNTVESTVRDGSQYGVSDTGAPVLPPVLGTQEEAEANGAAMFGIPSVGSGVIPESSLPMGGAPREPTLEPSFTTSSVAPHSTTAQLAGQVPLEPRGAPKVASDVPQVVSDSQQAAHFDPEAAASASAVHDKSAVEEELRQVVPEEPATAESGPATGVPHVVSDSQHAAHAAPEAAASPEAVREKAAVEQELKQKVPEESSTAESGHVAGVPDVVSESQQSAHVAPEAAASPEAVREKAAVEEELKQKVPKESSTSDSVVPEAIAGGAAAVGATLIGAALLAKDKAAEAYASTTAPAAPAGADEVPEVVTESQEAAHVSPEASASAEAVHEKAQFESELKRAVPEVPATSESGLLGKSEAGITGKLAAGATAAGAAVAGAAYAAKDRAADAYTSAAGQPPSAIFSEPTVDGSVPAVVSESQQKAHAAPEASANPEAVREKTAFENELRSEVSKAPATSESGAFGKSEQGITGKAAAATAAAGATAAGAAYAARDKAAEATAGGSANTFLPSSVQSAIDNMNSHVAPLSAGASDTAPASISVPHAPEAAVVPHVPEAVVESQHEAHFPPEASAEPEAVAEKSQVEQELLRRVPVANQSGDPAPSQSAALAFETAPVKSSSSASPGPGASSSAAKSEPSASAAAAAAVDTGLNAPADSQAQTFATKHEQLAAPALAAPTANDHSRDVSPMTRPDSHPQTTTGADSDTVPSTSTGGPSTPQKANKRASGMFKNTPESVKTSNSEATSTVDKGSKKKGFLAKLKEKFRS